MVSKNYCRLSARRLVFLVRAKLVWASFYILTAATQQPSPYFTTLREDAIFDAIHSAVGQMEEYKIWVIEEVGLGRRV